MSLKDDILNIFTSDMTDDDFASGIADAIKSFVDGCTLTVMPATLAGSDTSPSGTFAGAGSASWQITGSTIESTIKAVLTPQMTDAQLAQAIASALDADTPTWTVSISGTTTVPGTPPVPTPSSDSGTVTPVFVSAPVNAGLVSCFQAMGNMQQGGDDYFATQLAALITSYYTTATITGKGASHLSGVVFSIVIAPGS